MSRAGLSNPPHGRGRCDSVRRLGVAASGAGTASHSVACGHRERALVAADAWATLNPGIRALLGSEPEQVAASAIVDAGESPQWRSSRVLSRWRSVASRFTSGRSVRYVDTDSVINAR